MSIETHISMHGHMHVPRLQWALADQSEIMCARDSRINSHTSLASDLRTSWAASWTMGLSVTRRSFLNHRMTRCLGCPALICDDAVVLFRRLLTV